MSGYQHSEVAGPRLLGIYLNDHLAGATAGSELARRAATSHGGTPVGAVLARLAREVTQDRAALVEMMTAPVSLSASTKPGWPGLARRQPGSS